MKAVYTTGGGIPVYGDFADPLAGAGQAIVQIGAAALTNLDIAIAEGRHYLARAGDPAVVGRECVGRLSDGTRQYYNVNATVAPFGSMAEYALVDPASGFPVPDGISDALAAAIGNAGLAAWLPLSWRARMRPGDRVMILGATGTSGLIAVAAAKLLGASHVVAVGRNSSALERAERLGADRKVALSQGLDLAKAFADAAEGPIDIVIDYLNGAPAEAALEVLGTGGRMIQIGSTLAPGIHLPAQLARKQLLDVLGFAYYHAPIAEQAAAYRKLCSHCLTGDIEIDFETRPLSAFAAAWEQQKSGTSSRLVIVPDAMGG